MNDFGRKFDQISFLLQISFNLLIEFHINFRANWIWHRYEHTLGGSIFSADFTFVSVFHSNEIVCYAFHAVLSTTQSAIWHEEEKYHEKKKTIQVCKSWNFIDKVWRKRLETFLHTFIVWRQKIVYKPKINLYEKLKQILKVFNHCWIGFSQSTKMLRFQKLINWV